MDNKVTIIGYTGSGKTTSMVGMYICMSGAGYKHYSIGAVDPNQDIRLEQMWDKLYDGTFPAANNNSEKYVFHIAHDYEPVCDFEWLDYPGGILSQPNHKDYQAFQDSVSSSDCLLLVLDGAKFAIDAENEMDYEKKLENKIKFDKGMRNELKEFNALSAKGIRIPPTCVMITKCDLINPDYRDIIEKVLKKSMESLFSGNDLIIITSISLGANIIEDGPEPFCIEEPIAFAVLTILIKYMEALKELRDKQRGLLYKERNFFTEWLDRKELERIREELKKLENVGNKWSSDASKLIELFDSNKDVFVCGRKYKFCEYMRKVFAELNK